MECYQVKAKRLSGTRTRDIIRQGRLTYHQIEQASKRRPYIRSAYFKKEKIFLDNFWPHLNQKTISDRARLLRLLPCALELISTSRCQPLTLYESKEILYRFTGKTVQGEVFFVQIKEDVKRKQKFFMSVFPHK